MRTRSVRQHIPALFQIKKLLHFLSKVEQIFAGTMKHHAILLLINDFFNACELDAEAERLHCRFKILI